MSTIKAVAQKKTLFALVLALTIFGAVYGFAATLNVGSNQLSAGNASVASCQASGTPTGTYSVAYDSTITSYQVSGVTVTGIDVGCNGKTLSATLTGTGGTSLGTVSGTIAGTSLALTPAAHLDAKNVTGISVAING
ncbi:MAG TPA: hypothetical protein VHQ89_05130 [Gaiellaceae bacterium]|jgi:hypothetical protein|nr:hypothetical protein [Gaiellaceae bacterium]